MYVKKRSLIASVVLVLGLAVGAIVGTTGGNVDAAGPPHDFALYDGTNPASDDIRCGSSGPFEVYGSFRAFNGAATIRATFNDGDFVDFEIQAGDSFSFSHAAGSNSADRKVVITEQAGNVTGWMSASRHSGDRKILCRTTETP